MKKLIVPALLACLSLGGCASTGFLGFIATTDYVDRKLAAEEENAAAERQALKAEAERAAKEAQEQAARAEEAAGEAADQAAQAEEKADNAVTQAADARQTVAEISDETKAVLEKLEQRLASLPEETLRTLVEIIQASLPEEEGVDASAPAN